MNTRFCTARYHDIRITKGYEARGIADGVGACRAGRRNSVVWSL